MRRTTENIVLKAYMAGYEQGHNDTVENQYGYIDEKADNYLSEHIADIQEITDMIKYARHLHEATSPINLDQCRYCKHDIRHIIHLRNDENEM